MNRLFLCALCLLLPAAGALAQPPENRDRLRSVVPPDAGLIVEVDLIETVKAYESLWKTLESTPLVQQSSAMASLLAMQRMGIDTLIEMSRERLGVDPMKDLKAAISAVVFSVEGEPQFVMALQGKLPADVLDKLIPEGPPPDMRLQLLNPGPDAILIAAQPAGLPAAVESALAGKPAQALKELHPGLFADAPGAMLRASFALPAHMKASLAKEPQIPFRSLFAGLKRLDLTLGEQAGLRLSCEDEACATRAGFLLGGLRDSMMAGTHLLRAYGLLISGADLSQANTIPLPIRSAIGNRKALLDTLELLFPLPPQAPSVTRQDLMVGLDIPTTHLKGSIFTLGVLAAVAIPTFIDYVRKAQAAEGRQGLRQLSQAIEAYMVDKGDYPPADGWDEALLEGGFLRNRQDLLDPWQRPFLYTRGDGQSFQLTSYGRDGLPGGSGADEDLRYPER